MWILNLNQKVFPFFKWSFCLLFISISWWEKEYNSAIWRDFREGSINGDVIESQGTKKGCGSQSSSEKAAGAERREPSGNWRCGGAAQEALQPQSHRRTPSLPPTAAQSWRE